MPKVTPEELERLRLVAVRAEAKFKQAKQQRHYQERKDETRSKIITGGAFAAAVQTGTVSQNLLAFVLNRYVTNARDRIFLGLEPLEEGSATNPEAQETSTEDSLSETRGDSRKGDLFGDAAPENLADFDDEGRG